MNKIFTTLLFVLIVFTLANAQEVTDKQMTLITKVTADWCPKCGTYGWEFTKQMQAAAQGKDAILWNVHHSGDLETPTSNEIANNLVVFSQPLIFINTDADDLGLTGSNISQTVALAVEAIDIYSALGAFFAMGGEAKVTDGRLTVNTKVKFLADADIGEYYVGMYIVEKNKVAFQQNVGSNAVHHSVLTHSILPTTFGNKIATAPVALDEEFTISGSLDNLVLHNGKPEDTKVVVVLWNYFDNKYNFANARELDLVIENTSSVQSSTNAKLDFTANSNGQDIEVTFNKAVDEDVNFQLYNVSGQLIPTVANKIDAKNYKLSVQDISGNHFLIVRNNNDVVTKQFAVVR